MIQKNSISEAIVFKRKQLLHKDMMVTLFTQDQGRLVAIAKGIKSITSRRAPHLQTGNLLNVTLQHRTEQTIYLQQSQLISALSVLKENPEKVNVQYSLFFVLDRLLPEQQPEIQIYWLVKRFLVTLAKNETTANVDNSQIWVNFFETLHQILYNLGYISANTDATELIPIVEEIIHEKVPMHAII